MQRRHDPGRAGLPDMAELDDIVRTEPSPCLFHKSLMTGAIAATSNVIYNEVKPM